MARLSRQHALYSALTFIYTHALDDYVAPIAELIFAIVRSRQSTGQTGAEQLVATGPAAPPAVVAGITGRPEDGQGASEQHYLGFKLMAYLRCCLQGNAFPPGAFS